MTFLASLGREKHLPAEIADELSEKNAHRMVAKLAAVGAHAVAIPTDQVQGVRHRAAEAWPSRLAGGFNFTEIDGMIFRLAPLNARENLEYIRRIGRSTTPWEYERGSNHMHADMSAPARERVREEATDAAKLESALREAYPGRRFVISHIPGYAVSFWQNAGGRPDLTILHSEPRVGKVWCQTCQRNQPYSPLDPPDAEFPQAEWGRCSACGDDVLVRTREILREIGTPERR